MRRYKVRKVSKVYKVLDSKKVISTPRRKRRGRRNPFLNKVYVIAGLVSAKNKYIGGSVQIGAKLRFV